LRLPEPHISSISHEIVRSITLLDWFHPSRWALCPIISVAAASRSMCDRDAFGIKPFLGGHQQVGFHLRGRGGVRAPYRQRHRYSGVGQRADLATSHLHCFCVSLSQFSENRPRPAYVGGVADIEG